VDAVEELRRGLDAGKGLRFAGQFGRLSRKMLSNPRTSHPFYWSAFAAYGRP